MTADKMSRIAFHEVLLRATPVPPAPNVNSQTLRDHLDRVTELLRCANGLTKKTAKNYFPFRPDRLGCQALRKQTFQRRDGVTCWWSTSGLGEQFFPHPGKTCANPANAWRHVAG